ncbi:MAG TPA: sulfatase-like hydrolase/transferase [Pirellulaceae bacterium]|nr:sulfatase-like hydrolase/transferase [Pirellulaceae bacterium]
MLRSYLQLVAIGLAVGLLASATRTSAAERPNFVLLMADDQGWGDVAYNGNADLKTPVLDEMARTALRLERFYAAAPVCSPTRGSVLTGRHPNRFGCFSWGYMLRPEEITLAEVLKEAGYATGHFGKWHLGPVAADVPNSPGTSGFDQWFSSPNFYENSPLMSANGKVVKTDGEGSQVTVAAALEFIRAAANSERPFLAVVWFGSPHLPHQALEADREPYASHPPAMQNYWGEITAMDRAIGKLREELRKLDIADNTLVWYTSDNGATTPGSTGGLRGKKGSVWEGGLRVPAIVEWPARIKSPRTSSLPAGTVDILPTVLELAGASVPKDRPLDGVSLKPLIDGQMTRRDQSLGFWVYPAPGKPVRSQEILAKLARVQAGEADAEPEFEEPSQTRYSETELPGHAAWIDGDFKLHRLPGKAGEFRYELYDLAADAKEETDLAAKHAGRVAAMKQQLADWQQSVVQSLNREDYGEPK